MLLRRITEHIKAQNWTAVSVLIFALFAAYSHAAANRLSSDHLSPDFLSACDSQTAPFGAYDREIAKAVDELIAMGVFTEAEFHGVNIGFCNFRSVQGPAATASCASDTILLDSRYAAKNQSLVLKATLAHEMKHVFQHRDLRTKHGENYCASAQYREDRTWMEEEADAFGDSVAALFFTGRAVEINNECPVVVSVYLEPDDPLSRQDGAPHFMTAPAQSTITPPVRALSKSFKFYAETMPYDGEKQVWSTSATPHKRRINGKVYGLVGKTLPNPQRSSGPFQLTLSCERDTHRD